MELCMRAKRARSELHALFMPQISVLNEAA